MVKAVFAVTDEGDEGASSLLDMTKVTRSTLADKGISPCPFSASEQITANQWLIY